MTNKPFLKWPGGKYRLVNRIGKKLGTGKRLVEPFVGSAAVFLNTSFDHYLLADSNPDLINLYIHLQKNGEPFIDYCHSYFTPDNNSEEQYYNYRTQFNQTSDKQLKSALFIYLNRHCYNGLCRYNARNEFNTPFGRYKKPYFPLKEMQTFFKASQKARFIHASFSETMKQVEIGDVVYCDPPYTPLSDTACFTDYFAGGFDWDNQVELADWARKLAKEGIPVVISNHNTRSTRSLYEDAGAQTERFRVRRMISCDAGNRGKVGELLAVFGQAR